MLSKCQLALRVRMSGIRVSIQENKQHLFYDVFQDPLTAIGFDLETIQVSTELFLFLSAFSPEPYYRLKGSTDLTCDLISIHNSEQSELDELSVPKAKKTVL